MATKIGTAANDKLYGTQWADALKGLAGNDYLSGQGGNDHLDGGAGEDKLDGGAGNDVLHGGDAVDALFGGSGNDDLFGDAGADYMDGGTGHDELFGGDGADRLRGGDGNDWLTGGAGDDSLIGGAGKDIFDFDNNGYRDAQGNGVTLDLGTDTITGFNADDDMIGLAWGGGNHHLGDVAVVSPVVGPSSPARSTATCSARSRLMQWVSKTALFMTGWDLRDHVRGCLE